MLIPYDLNSLLNQMNVRDVEGCRGGGGGVDIKMCVGVRGDLYSSDTDKCCLPQDVPYHCTSM